MNQLLFPLKAVFIAIPLEESAKRQFQALQEALKDFGEILSFQNPLSPHLTVQYWPTLMEIEFRQILRQAETLATKAMPFTLKILGVDTFGSRGQDTVLFLKVPFSDPLARLRKLCPWPQGTSFSPHITLARIRHPQRFAVVRKNILKALKGTAFETPVDRLRLYAEVDGRKQTPLMDFLLSASEPPL